MSNLHKTEHKPGGHYRVVRYYNDFGIGLIEDVIGSHLTKHEAEKMLRENPPVSSDEEVAIEDENTDSEDSH